MTARATTIRASLGLITLAGVGLALSFAAAAAPPEIVTTAEPAAMLPPADDARPDADSLARVITTKNPFRAHRSPALVRYSVAAAAGLGAPPAPPVQRPTLVLSGVLLGDEPAALIDGLPGFEHTRALRVGESVAGYRLREVSDDRAIVVGPDTTYVLLVRTRSP